MLCENRKGAKRAHPADAVVAHAAGPRALAGGGAGLGIGADGLQKGMGVHVWLLKVCEGGAGFMQAGVSARQFTGGGAGLGVAAERVRGGPHVCVCVRARTQVASSSCGCGPASQR